MENLSYFAVVDKSSWPRGEWDSEPDKCQFETEVGLPGLIVRGPSGALCGYAAIPEGHKLFGRSYDASEVKAEAHGGLTFSGACKSGANEQSDICHRPSPGEPEHVWWFGFDCAHAGDLMPSLWRRFSWSQGGVYRNLSYVRAEVEALAKQLKEQG